MPTQASPVARINNMLTFQLYKSCDGDWDCNQGKCDAFEKALRICLSKLTLSTYECSYTEGKPNMGVMTSSKSMTQGGYNFILLILCLGVSLLFIFWNSEEGSFEWNQNRATWLIAFVAGGAFLTVSNISIMVATPPVLQRAENLKEPCTIGKYHMCAEQLPEEPPWNRSISPLAFYSLHTLLFCPLILILLLGCYVKIREMQSRMSQPSDVHERTPLTQA